MLRKSVSSRRAFNECRIRLKLSLFFFQRPAERHHADVFPRLFLKAGMQGAELMGLFGDQFLQSLVVVVIQDRRAAAARLVDQPIEPRRFPLFKPSRYGVTADLQDLTDLADGMALITQQDGMRTSAEGALLTMVIGGRQRLLLGFSERGNEAPCHGSVRVRYPTHIMHENFRLGT